MVQSPVQNQPVKNSVPSGTAQPSVPSVPSLSTSPASRSGPTGGPSLPSLPKPKLPPLKLPLLLVLVALVAVALGIFFVFDKSLFNKPQPSPSPSAEDHSKPPEKDLFGVNGKIVAIDKEKKIFEVVPTTPNWDKHWMVSVGGVTVLATLSDWTSPRVENNLGMPIERLAREVPKLRFEDYKIGSFVYLMAAEGQDFVKDIDIFEPFAILLQEGNL